VYTFLKRKQTVEGVDDAELAKWVARFEQDKREAGLAFWYDIHMGIQESLREF
jgi:glyceraldehyde-3-phosphate dehydrogenase (ferredoxin)